MPATAPVATVLAGLKRPTVGAWLVNVVALRRPDVVRDLFAAADAIRAVQTTGAADGPAQLRELSQRRKRAVDAALAAARELARAAGAGDPTRAQLAEVESTLTAAIADDEAAALVTAGRVLKALSYGGFGDASGGFGGGFAGAVVTAGPARTAAAGASRAAGSAAAGGSRAAGSAKAAGSSTLDEQHEAQTDAAAEAAAAREAAQRAAQAAVARAEEAVAEATNAEVGARARVDALTAEIDDLRASLAQAEKTVRAARASRLAAERDLATAQRRRDRTA
jgi:hypothetical protein